MKAILMGLFVMVSLHTFANDSVCDSLKFKNLEKKIRNKKNDSVKFPEGLEGLINKNNIFILAETHFHTDTAIVDTVLSEINKLKSGKICMGFEFGIEENSFAETLVGFQENINVIDSLVRNNNTSYGSIEKLLKHKLRFYKVIKYYTPIFQYAKKYKIDTHTYDHVESNHNDISMDVRNEAMGNNITNYLMGEMNCDTVIILIGKAHLSNNIYDATTTILDFLPHKLRRMTISINLQMTKQVIPDEYKAWNKCSAPDIEVPFVFRNIDYLENSVLISPDTPTIAPFWNEMDYTILIP